MIWIRLNEWLKVWCDKMKHRQLYEIIYFRNGLEEINEHKVIMSFRQVQRLRKIPWITITNCEKVENTTKREVELLPI